MVLKHHIVWLILIEQDSFLSSCYYILTLIFREKRDKTGLPSVFRKLENFLSMWEYGALKTVKVILKSRRETNGGDEPNWGTL
jgi:hypothetical protein